MKIHVGGRLESSIMRMATKIDTGAVIAYVEGLFTRDVNGGDFLSVACSQEELSELLSGRLPPTLVDSGLSPFHTPLNFEDKQQGIRLFQNMRSEFCDSLRQKFPENEWLFLIDDIEYRKRIRGLSFKGKLEHYSYTHFIPSAASTLARAQLEEWDGFSFDEKSVTNMLLAAAEQGDPEAHYLLAIVGELGYQEPSFVIKPSEYLIENENDRKRHFRFAIEAGHRGALDHAENIRFMNEANAQCDRESLEDNVEALRKAALSGNPEEICQLGLELATLAEKLDVARLEEAQTNTTRRYNEAALDHRTRIDKQKTDEVSKLRAESQQCFSDAAKTYPPANYWIKVPNESLEARIIRWRSAAYPAEGLDRSNTALFELGRLYSQQGEPCFNLHAAIRCFEDAIELNILNARYELARIILKYGKESGKNIDLVVGLLRAEDELQNIFGFEDWTSPSAFLLARCYLRGEGIEQDYFIAKSLFDRWKSLRDSDSLGKFCIYGVVAFLLSQNHPGSYASATELLLKRLDFLDFKNEAEALLSIHDLQLLEMIGAEQSYPDELPSNSPEDIGIGDVGFLGLLLFALEKEDISTLYSRLSETCLGMNSSIFEKYFLGGLLSNGRFGFDATEEAYFYFEQVKKVLESRGESVTTASENPDEFEAYLGNRVDSYLTRLKPVIARIREQRAAEEAKKEMLSFLSHTLTNSLTGTSNTLLRIARSLNEPDASAKGKFYRSPAERLISLVANVSFTERLIENFKLYTSDPDALKTAWIQDRQGGMPVLRVLALSLRQSLLRFLFAFEHGSDFARLMPGIDRNAFIPKFMDEAMAYDLETDTGTDEFIAWTLQNLPCLDLNVDLQLQNHIASNGPRFIVIFSIIGELFGNALKFSDGQKAIQLTIKETQSDLEVRCTNTCNAASTASVRGGQKGISFMKTICGLVGATLDVSANGEIHEARAWLPHS